VNTTAFFIGTFAPVPGIAGFEIPVFRTARSDMTLIQDLDENFHVRRFVDQELAGIKSSADIEITASERQPGIFAIRCLDNSLKSEVRLPLRPPWHL
jgi:hypothetical protein